MTRLLAYLPRGNTLDERAWHKRHVFLQGLLALHLLGLYVFGVLMGRTSKDTLVVLSVPAACLVLGHLIRHRRVASVLITAGLTYCSAVLVSFSNGSIEAHFHFFIMIGFIALYQDWVPFLWNVVFTVLSHGLGSAVRTDLIFNHPAGQTSPWVWSAIHGIAVLAACFGVVIFWETTEQEQRKTLNLTNQLADAEITRRRFTSDLLVNLARRNQSLLYRQLGLINQLEDQEEDPDALANLFRLDHLATRIRRNAESLLVLSGEEPPRTWGRPVALVDVVRAAIAETEDLDRVVFTVDERTAVFGNAVADLTHLVAELVENAVHFSPPQASVIIRTRPYLQVAGAQVLTVEDWGVGMRPEDMAEANDLLAEPRDVDLSVSQRLGLHVVARLAQRHGIEVSLTPTPGGGVTAAVVLPPTLFSEPGVGPDEPFDEEEIPARVVPTAVAASTIAPAADLPAPDLAAAVAASAPRAPEERWIDLTDRSAGNGHGAGEGYVPAGHAPDRHAPAGGNGAGDGRVPGTGDRAGGNGGAAPPAVPAGTDWSGWWEPSHGDQPDGEPLSPIAARPPLAERIKAPAPTPPVPAANPARASASAAAASGGPDPDGGGEGVLSSRRVPQAHLAPELRRSRPAGGDGTEERLPDAAEARAALSRYQASRQAARAVVEEGAGPPAGRVDEAGPEPPSSGGGWP